MLKLIGVQGHLHCLKFTKSEARRPLVVRLCLMSRFSEFCTLNPNPKNRVLSRMMSTLWTSDMEKLRSCHGKRNNRCTGRAGWHLHSNVIVSLGRRWIINRRHQALDPEEHQKLVGMVLVLMWGFSGWTWMKTWLELRGDHGEERQLLCPGFGTRWQVDGLDLQMWWKMSAGLREASERLIEKD